MPSTYMALTNRLLRRLNEVEITESDFLSVRGIQATAKDCVLDTIREINTTRTDWPFNAVEHSQVLEIGTEEYAWPIDFTAADWTSFQIQKDDTLDTDFEKLKPISREEWYHNYRDRDYDSEGIGIRRPTMCFPSHGQGWGVSPSPDKEYPIKYRYHKNPDDLELFDDQTTIPTKFDFVITAGALYHLNIFKENAEAAALMETKYDKGVQKMAAVFLPNPREVYGQNMNAGGSQRSMTRGIWTGQ